jgi:hypothetical protein
VARSLAVGWGWACALLVDGATWCWGDDNTNVTTSSTHFPRQVPLEHVIALEGAADVTYAVTEGGALYTWGQADSYSGLQPSAEPVLLEPRGIAEVAAADGYACLRDEKGGVECWEPPKRIGTRVPIVNAAHVAVGAWGGCALASDGDVSCWKAKAPAIPERVVQGAEQIALGNVIGCAIVHGGAVRCWGAEATARRAEVLFAGADRLRGGADSLCALADSGAPRCVFGDPPPSQPWLVPQPEPLASSPALRGAVDLRAGVDWGCAIAAGAIGCWEQTLPGPDGPTPLTIAPVYLGNLAALDHVRQVAVADDHKCIVTVDDELDCWGDNEHGQLGQGDFTELTGPTRVPGIGAVRSGAAGDEQTCAVTRAGDVLCFGATPFAQGQCPPGVDYPTPRHCEPKPVRVASNAIDVTVGPRHSCLLTQEGHAQCWGQNDFGQLGDGTRAASATPVTVLDEVRRPLEELTSLHAVDDRTCALDRQHRVWCWGRNEPGTQGRPYNSPRKASLASHPFSVGPAEQIASGCVRLKGGEVRCWGPLRPEAPKAYEPARVGICRTALVSDGPGFCSSDLAGETSCLVLRGNDLVGFTAAIDGTVSMSGGRYGDHLCAVDRSGRLLCFRFSNPVPDDVYPEIGTVVATPVHKAPTQACPVDPVPRSLPQFPPEPYTRVSVHQVDPVGPTHDLTRAQVARLVSLMNDQSNFGSISLGCTSPDHHVYRFDNGGGETIAEVHVGWGCLALEAVPDTPAHFRGSTLAPKMVKALVSLCNDLKLTGCSGDGR